MKGIRILAVVFLSIFMLTLTATLIATTIVSSASLIEVKYSEKPAETTSKPIQQTEQGTITAEKKKAKQAPEKTVNAKPSKERSNTINKETSKSDGNKKITSSLKDEKKHAEEDIGKLFSTYMPLIYNMNYKHIEEDIDKINQFHTSKTPYAADGEDRDNVINYYKNGEIEETLISYKIDSIKFVNWTSNKKAIVNTTANYIENGEKKVEKAEFTLEYVDSSKSWKVAGIK